MLKYKILIASSGIGSRVENYSKNLNKAMITVGRKPAICYIIDKIPQDVEIVITVGHRKEYLIQFLKMVYSGRNITFVDVDKFAGEGSGLGYSILKAKEHLQCPFVFITNDCITDEPLAEPVENYLGYSNEESCDEYRTILPYQNNVSLLLPKADNQATSFAYIGIAGIKDFDVFWNLMESGVNDGSIEQGESYAISKMILETSFKCQQFTWHDTGNVKKYIETCKHFAKDDKINILKKDDEDIWFIGNKVVKFHINPDFISERVKRVKHLGKYVPKILSSSENLYMYEKMIGDTFTYNLKHDIFELFLQWVKGFWQPVSLDEEKTKEFNDQCRNFYFDKTHERINQYFYKYKRKDLCETINGKQYGTISSILDKVPWDTICTGTPTNFHGDLHFENILVNKLDFNTDFKLIDWRQSFGNIVEYGDMYYDLAKLKHGFIISHEMVNENLFGINISGKEVDFYYFRKNVLEDIEKQFDAFVIANGFDLYKVNILTSLIFLNVAALHHHPYSDMLFYLGKTKLATLLERGS